MKAKIQTRLCALDLVDEESGPLILTEQGVFRMQQKAHKMIFKSRSTRALSCDERTKSSSCDVVFVYLL